MRTDLEMAVAIDGINLELFVKSDTPQIKKIGLHVLSNMDIKMNFSHQSHKKYVEIIHIVI